MKKWALLYFVLITTCGLAQDWSGMYPGATHFYSVNGSNAIVTIKPDTNYIQGTNQVYVPKLLYRDVFNENISDTNCLFWGAQQCTFKYDNPTILGSKIQSSTNRVTYFDFENDSLNINLALAVGDTQIVYKKGNDVLKYKLIFRDTASVFNNLDSIVKFQIIFTDTLNNLIASSIQGDTIIFSKNIGLFKGFSFDNFPFTIKKIELMGIRNPNYGFIGLTPADVSDFQVGDIYEIRIIEPDYPTFYNEILNRTDSPGNVQYDLKRIIYTSVWTGLGFNYFWDTLNIQENYSKQIYIDDFTDFQKYVKDTSIFNGCYSEMAYILNNGYECSMYCPSKNCYGDADCYMWTFHNETYIAGLGIYYGYYYTIGEFGTSYKNLTYFKKQGIECGSSFVLSTNEKVNNFQINIFPNPANEQLTVQTDKIIQNGRVVISDLTGREILVRNLNPTNSNTLTISDFSNGIYLMQIYSEGKIIKTEKLVIEK